MKKEVKVFCSRGIYNREEGKKPHFTKTVKVKEFFEMHGETFAIHRNTIEKDWLVSHVGTGYRVCCEKTANRVKISAIGIISERGVTQTLEAIRLAAEFIAAQKENTDEE